MVGDDTNYRIYAWHLPKTSEMNSSRRELQFEYKHAYVPTTPQCARHSQQRRDVDPRGEQDDELNQVKGSFLMGSTCPNIRVLPCGINTPSTSVGMAEYFMAQLGIEQGIATANMAGKTDGSELSVPCCSTTFKQGFYDKFTVWQHMSGGSRGTMVEVAKVIQKSTGTIMVCKMITWVPENDGVCSAAPGTKAGAHQDETVTREVALREVHATIAAGQQSRGVVPVHDVYEEGNVFHMIMEEAKGGDLFDAVAKNGHMNENDAKAVAKQMLETIGQLHANNICHRDIKLENIVCSRPSDYSEVKLVDFGLAYQARNPLELASMGRACGTPAYLAPECIAAELSQQCDTRKVYGPQCDLWSLGVALYALLCGRLPFRGRNIRELARNIYCGGAIDVSGENWNCVSSEAKDLVLKLLNRDPTARITVNGALRHPWIAGRPNDRRLTRKKSLDETKRCASESDANYGGRSPAGTSSVNRSIASDGQSKSRFPTPGEIATLRQINEQASKLPWE